MEQGTHHRRQHHDHDRQQEQQARANGRPYPSSSVAGRYPSRSFVRHRAGTVTKANTDADVDTHLRAGISARRASLGVQPGNPDHDPSRTALRDHAHTHLHLHSSAPASGSGLTLQVEDTTAAGATPTVLLVHSGRTQEQAAEVVRSPTLPFQNGTVAHVRRGTLARAREAEFAALEREREEERVREQERGRREAVRAQDVPGASVVASPAFSPVPLTPRSAPYPSAVVDELGFLTAQARPPDIEAAAGSHRSEARPSTSFPSRWLSWRRPAPQRHQPSDSFTYSSVSASSSSCSSDKPFPPSPSKSASSTAVALPHVYKQPLQSSPAQTLRATDKLTKKFPISGSVRLGRGRGRVGDRALAIVLLDESEGLGMERVDRWTAHKWFLFLTLCVVFVYGAGALAWATLTWYQTWPHADIMLVADYDIVVLVTLFGALTLLTFAVGITGTLLNSRALLAVYALFLWPALVALLAIGYAAYKRTAFALDRKLNRAWSQWYTPAGRAVVQVGLRCCGYYSPLHDAAASQVCYARSTLPGCKGRLLAFERANLASVWRVAFALVPVHLLGIAVALLCANHVTRRFGKGITPRQYRLREEDVAADAERLAKEGYAVARPVLSRPPSSRVFREDKKDHGDLHGDGGWPAALRPGLPPVSELPYKYE